MSILRRPNVPGFVLAALFLFVTAAANAEDTVWVFRDGRIETWRGILVEERADGSVRLRTEDGKVRAFSGKDIANIVRDRSAAATPEPEPEAEVEVEVEAEAEVEVEAEAAVEVAPEVDAPTVPEPEVEPAADAAPPADPASAPAAAPPALPMPEDPAPGPAPSSSAVPVRVIRADHPAPEPAPRGARFALHAWGGFAEPALDDVNRTLGEDEAAFAAAGADVRFDRFGRAPEFGAGLVVRTARGMSLGVEGGYQSSRVDAAHEDAASSVSTAIALHVVDVLATAELRLGAGLHVGAAAGVGLGRAVQDARTRDLANPANDAESHSEWEGAGFSGAAFARLEIPVGRALAAFVQGGYRRRNLGTFAGETRSAGAETTTEPADNGGNPVEFDFSGPFARAGLAIALGR